MSLPELTAVLKAVRDKENRDREFQAAIQGIDLNEDSDQSSPQRDGQQIFDDMRARIASGGQAADANDILALQGQMAQQAGFGIGQGLDYELAGDSFVW